jgi:hypothetical protein
MFAAAESVSAPEVPSVRRMTHANPPTTSCIKPMWYSTDISAEKKTTVGSTPKANVRSSDAPGGMPVSPSWGLIVNSNDAPFVTNPSRVSKNLPACSNSSYPTLVFSVKTANANCSTVPTATTRHGNRERFELISQAASTITTRPSRPTRRSMGGGCQRSAVSTYRAERLGITTRHITDSNPRGIAPRRAES